MAESEDDQGGTDARSWTGEPSKPIDIAEVATKHTRAIAMLVAVIAFAIWFAGIATDVDSYLPNVLTEFAGILLEVALVVTLIDWLLARREENKWKTFNPLIISQSQSILSDLCTEAAIACHALSAEITDDEFQREVSRLLGARENFSPLDRVNRIFDQFGKPLQYRPDISRGLLDLFDLANDAQSAVRSLRDRAAEIQRVAAERKWMSHSQIIEWESASIQSTYLQLSALRRKLTRYQKQHKSLSDETIFASLDEYIEKLRRVLPFQPVL